MLTTSTDFILASAIVAAFAVAAVWWSQRRKGHDSRAQEEERRRIQAWAEPEQCVALVEQEERVNAVIAMERQRYVARITRQLAGLVDDAGSLHRRSYNGDGGRR